MSYDYWPEDLLDLEPMDKSFYENQDSTGDDKDIFSSLLRSPSPYLSFQEETNMFRRLNIEQWNPSHVVDWLMHVCRENNIERTQTNITAFNMINGQQLLSMTLNDFSKIDHFYGKTFYESFHQFRNKEGSSSSSSSSNTLRNEYPVFRGLYDDLSPTGSGFSSGGTAPLPAVSPSGYDLEYYSPGSGGTMYENQPHYPSEYDGPSSFDDTPLNAPEDPHAARDPPRRSRRPRGPKLWEFLLSLLNDPTTNPSLIRWENEAEGVFRLVQPDAIAQRWGGRRSNDSLSYDYFARAMRYHYKKQVLISVPERKLVYKFGPKVNDARRAMN
ncbi:ETS homologous factor-like isoform X4 [Oratosquilla oratoria]|uniref:ETS homologous factor-like isoform X4 n=1 Tax=Oratosquilla oratoria TaxID=337810 RepID=UPI003F775FC0